MPNWELEKKSNWKVRHLELRVTTGKKKIVLKQKVNQKKIWLTLYFELGAWVVLDKAAAAAFFVVPRGQELKKDNP